MQTRLVLRDALGNIVPVTGMLRVGRGEDCQIRLPDRSVSRLHAILWVQDSELYLRDENSINGTYLNGQRLAPGVAAYLEAGDRVQIGEAIYHVELLPGAAPPGASGARGAQAPPPPVVEYPSNQAKQQPIPQAVAAPLSAFESKPKEKKRSRLPVILAALFALTACVFVAGGAIFYFLVKSNTLTVKTTVLPRDEATVMSILGPPEYFTESMIPASDNATYYPTIRSQWYYLQREVMYTFVNGEYVGTDELLPAPPSYALPSLKPDQVRAGMSQWELAAVIGETPKSRTPLPASLAPDAEVVFFRGVTAGFQSKKLVYVRTEPYLLTPSSALPPAEQSALFPLDPLADSRQGGEGNGLALIKAIPRRQGVADLVDSATGGYDLLSSLKDLYDTGNMVRLNREIYAASSFLRQQSDQLEESAKSETDAVKRQALLNAANLARQRANGIENEVLPTLERMQRGWFSAKTGSPIKGEDPDAALLESLWNRHMKDIKGRPGEIRTQMEGWLQEHTDWDSMSNEARASVVISLIEQRVKQLCPNKNSGDYDFCRAAALNTVVNEFKGNVSLTGYTEVMNELDRLKGKNVRTDTPTPTETETATTTATATETETPTATGTATITFTPKPGEAGGKTLLPSNVGGKLNICSGNEKVTVKFSWDPAGEFGVSIAGYEWVLLRGHPGRNDFAQRAAGVTTNTYAEEIVECGYEYKIKVRAVYINGNTSDWVTGNIKLQSPLATARPTKTPKKPVSPGEQPQPQPGC